jgi:competence ComEA-like helix-hairpin-helix protein
LKKKQAMNWKEFAADYLNFTRKDRIAILVIVLIMLGVILSPAFSSKNSMQKPVVPDTTWISAMKKLELKETENGRQPFSQQNKNEDDYAYHYDRTKNNYFDKQKGELFYFDPNTISEDGWKKLGIRDKTIQTIRNYLSKGGHFKKPEDLQKVYGLHKDEYERIAPYVKIEIENPEVRNNNDQPENPSFKNFTSRYTVIDINAVDTTAFISLPGIGSKLAARIINFRDKLGGFYTIAQVGETFGLPDSTFQKIKQFLKLENTSIKKININTATVDELKSHPYIKYSIANPIIAYRNEHGPFLKIEDIKKVMIITDEIYSKIVPYLTVQ